MTAVRFDTLSFANKLKAVGFEPKQAETMAQLQEEIIASHDNTLVTKNDLLNLATKSDLLAMEVRLISAINGSVYRSLTLLALLQGIVLSTFAVLNHMGVI